MLLSSVTLLVNIVVMVVYYLDLPWLSSCTIGMPLFALMNSVAAHIYRNIRFKVYTDHTITSSVLNKDLIGLSASDPTGAGVPNSPSSKHKSNSRHVLDITFQRSVTTSSETGARPDSYSTSIQGGAGILDLEKQDGVR